ncbi:MAG: type II toxin-antitoxin system VapC family toxin [Desulfamplus sp.]|nr:type II toxin-antitoxin system VapC family toxin [Desulfamplus sp.]
MTFLLDTNVCIKYLNGKSEKIREHIEFIEPDDVVLCSIVRAELIYGAMKSKNPEKNLEIQKKFMNRFISFPFDDDSARIYGEIRSELEKLGTPIGPNDLMIAAIAIQNDVVLVTHNTKEFGRIKTLKIADWE